MDKAKSDAPTWLGVAFAIALGCSALGAFTVGKTLFEFVSTPVARPLLIECVEYRDMGTGGIITKNLVCEKWADGKTRKDLQN